MTYAPLIYALAGLCALSFCALLGLSAFGKWIDLKRAELDLLRGKDAPATGTTSRIEIADLKERLRKLEAIAAGVDL